MCQVRVTTAPQLPHSFAAHPSHHLRTTNIRPHSPHSSPPFFFLLLVTLLFRYDRKFVAQNYATTWFLLDVVSGVPFALLELILNTGGQASSLKVHGHALFKWKGEGGKNCVFRLIWAELFLSSRSCARPSPSQLPPPPSLVLTPHRSG